MPSPPVVTLEQIGSWHHFAMVLDGNAKRVVQYLDGSPVTRHKLQVNLPFRIGVAELGNWNARSRPKPAPRFHPKPQRSL